jgi:hypothetical protein
MPDVSSIPIIGSVVDTVSGIVGGDEADESIRDASQQASDTQWKMYNQMRSDLTPFRSGGEGLFGDYIKTLQGQMIPDQNALLNRYQDYVLGLINDKAGSTFSFDGTIQDPSMQYVMDEALKATERGAAARTGALSGSTQKALQKTAGNIANTYWQNAYQNALNTYNTNQNTKNTLANMLGNIYATKANTNQNYLQNLLSGATMGQNAATATGSAGLNTGNALANNQLLSGLSGASNSANTWSTVGQGVNNATTSISNILKNMTNNDSTSSATVRSSSYPSYGNSAWDYYDSMA